ncbi:MAG: hypothetical protein NDI62_00545 [Burkholderiales bacterium]|nr:hypothetical protein [Burkholderiales bacterium]
MKKNILTTILILTIFLTPFMSFADLPIWEDDDGTGSGGGYTYPGPGIGGGSGSSSGSSTSSKSNLFVDTLKADYITYTTARLHGTGGDTLNSTLPLTGYFRYSRIELSPIFCNDTYGTNMISTKDIKLGSTLNYNETTKNGNLFTSSNSTNSFYQDISNLVPDTTYYYCAIISNKENIAYGGASIVKQFHTSPYKTTVRTNGATSIKSTSAVLNGSYSSVEKTVTTYFEYKKATTSSTTSWEQDCEEKYSLKDNVGVSSANIYGKLKCNLSGLEPYTRYQFRAVAKNTSGTENKITYGNTLSFTTSPNIGPETGGTGTSGGSGTGSRDTTPRDSRDPRDPITNKCPNGATNYPSCTTNPDGTCVNGKTNPPRCDSSGPKICSNGATNYSLCTTYSDGTCVNGNTNPPICTSTGAGTDGGTNGGGTGGTGTDTDGGIGTWTSGGGTGGTGTEIGSGTGTTGGRTSGTWSTTRGSGTWVATTGTGGIAGATWYGTGNGTGTWVSATGSGTWTNGLGTGGAGSGTWGQPLTLGQTATPPNDAIVRYHEGIEHVFVRQIVKNRSLAIKYGYQEGTDLQAFAWYLADEFAKMFGYIDENRKEIRVSLPDIAAYQLVLLGNQLTVYEYYDNTIVDVRNVTTTFKEASDYEYYFKK